MSVANPLSPASPPPPSSAIADISYRNYDGELRTRSLRWWTIALATIKANVNRKRLGYWFPAAIILIIYFFLGIGHYLTQNVRQEFGSANPSAVNPYAMTLYQALSATNLLVFVATMMIGSASIASDNRANALLVYLSKPITRLDYLLGKWMGIFLLIAALTVLPALLMFLFFALAYNSDGFLKDNPTLILRLLGASLIPAALNTSLIIGFSSWSKSPRLAGAIYAAFYFVLGIVSGIFGHVLLAKDTDGKQPQVAAVVNNLSVAGVVNGIGMNLYDITPQQTMDQFRMGRRRRRRANNDDDSAATPQTFRSPERPNLPAMLTIGEIMILLPLAAAYARVRAVEVIRG